MRRIYRDSSTGNCCNKKKTINGKIATERKTAVTCFIWRAKTAKRARFIEACGTIEAGLSNALVNVVLTAWAVVAPAATGWAPLALFAGPAVRTHARSAPAASLASRARQPGGARASEDASTFRRTESAVKARLRRARIRVHLALAAQEACVTKAFVCVGGGRGVLQQRAGGELAAGTPVAAGLRGAGAGWRHWRARSGHTHSHFAHELRATVIGCAALVER